MSYESESKRLGRDPIVIAGLCMDYCSLTAGVGACTATETGDDKCYNTRVTCNDPANYTKTVKEYKCSQGRLNTPIGEELFPVLSDRIKKASTSTTAGSGLGKRAVLRVDISDFAHHDRGIDPYYSERSKPPEGTFWGRWLARNPYYEGRTLKMYYGFIGENGFNWADFKVHEYDIVDIHGVTDAKITVVAKDILVRTYSRKAQYPVANTGELLADIAAGAGSATLTPTGIGDQEYSASGTLKIGKEVFTFTRAGDALTLTANAQWGTEQNSHDAGDLVQECVTWDGINVIDVVNELIVTGAGIPSAYVPTAEWDNEKLNWLSLAIVKGILLKPEPIEKVLGELSEDFMFDIWWSTEEQYVKIKALSPESGGEVINLLTEHSNIVQGSLEIERQSKQRFTEVRVLYDKIDFSDDDKETNYKAMKISVNTDNASADKYNGNSIKVIKSRWFDSFAQANALASRLLARFSETPELVKFKLDQKDIDKLEMAGRIEIDSWQFQGFDGSNFLKRFQVLEINEMDDIGHSFMVKAFTSSFSAPRYAFVAPNSTPDYLSASENEKNTLGFICDNDGQMSNGDDGYYIA